MKNITYILLSTLFIGGMLTACDPINDKGPSANQEVYSASDLDVKATPIQVNGKNSNLIIVENHSKINSHWTAPQLIEDSTLSAKAYDTIYVTKTGTNAIRFNGKNYSCNVMKDLSVEVEQISHLTESLKTRLCIQGTDGSYTPSKDGAPSSFGNTFSKDNVKVVQELTAEGKKGNRLYVYNSNPTLSNWTFGTNKADKNVTSLFVSNVGTYPLTLAYTKADGTTGTLDLGNYTVEAFTYIPDFLINMCGTTGVKTWQWDGTSENGVWGNGGYQVSIAPSWWKVSLADIDAQAASKGTVAGDGQSATFTFDLGNMSFTKNNGTVGTFSFDMEDIVKQDWNSGSIKIKNANIPMGYLVNNGNAIPDKYYIVQLTTDKLTLCAPEPGAGSGGTAWFWCFKVKP
jgi:hypothetical protein